MKYNSTWKGVLKALEIPEDKHKEFKVAHAHAFEAVALLLKRRIKDREKAIFSKSNYDNPNWHLRQADTSGAYRELVELLNLMED